jgi:hypothetical protein
MRIFPAARAVAWARSIDPIIALDKVYGAMPDLKLKDLRYLAARAARVRQIVITVPAVRLCLPSQLTPRARAAARTGSRISAPPASTRSARWSPPARA